MPADPGAWEEDYEYPPRGGSQSPMAPGQREPTAALNIAYLLTHGSPAMSVLRRQLVNVMAILFGLTAAVTATVLFATAR
jgi:hypothetical protein